MFLTSKSVNYNQNNVKSVILCSSVTLLFDACKHISVITEIWQIWLIEKTQMREIPVMISQTSVKYVFV